MIDDSPVNCFHGFSNERKGGKTERERENGNASYICYCLVKEIQYQISRATYLDTQKIYTIALKRAHLCYTPERIAHLTTRHYYAK